MSRVMADQARAWLASFSVEEKAELVLEIPKKPTKTGYIIINVIAITKELKKTGDKKMYYQAQLQVEGGGQGRARTPFHS